MFRMSEELQMNKFLYKNLLFWLTETRRDVFRLNDMKFPLE